MKFYRLIMDPDINPLQHLPLVQRFQIMVSLSMMWTAIFCTAFGLWYWYGQLILAHTIVALGFLVTASVFGWAGRQGRSPATHRDHPRRDGTARYDDVWGA